MTVAIKILYSEYSKWNIQMYISYKCISLHKLLAPHDVRGVTIWIGWRQFEWCRCQLKCVNWDAANADSCRAGRQAFIYRAGRQALIVYFLSQLRTLTWYSPFSYAKKLNYWHLRFFKVKNDESPFNSSEMLGSAIRI